MHLAPQTLAEDTTDWTALRNFAALRGQLRGSLTPRCNLACWFCHNESDVPPPLTRRDRTRQPRARSLCPEHYLLIITALPPGRPAGCTAPAHPVQHEGRPYRTLVIRARRTG
ncbi:hypothetical protein [Streptomyces sp. NPDC018045]|uniref:hypothetical protein n=1 Tax=Streptomyces sp. NPDC018045 TaxID=3365037 RepID=UPI0037A6F0B8